MYDSGEHYPKILPCSHTVCLQCLDRIVATFARDTGQFRCPICRELITIPRGGVKTLPPSFLVNQLLDLMARQRREVIPKCSTHQTQVRFQKCRVGFGPGLLVLIDLVSGLGRVQLGSGLGQFQLRFSGFGFLVNQLLNLMARQRREVISKCSTHQTQVRLFTKGERQGSRGLNSALKSAKKFKTLLKLCTTYSVFLVPLHKLHI